MTMNDIVAIQRLRHDYGALRPVRIEHLTLRPGQRLALLGLDAPAAEALVHLLTGVTLPAVGTVSIFGRDTAAITDPQDWVATLDRFGLVSPRGTLVGELTVAQNMALAFTLSVDPVPDEVMTRVRRLAVEAGVPLTRLDQPCGAVSADVRARCHLARAIAPEPAVLLLEHANALTEPADAPAFGRDIARVADGRHLAVLAMTADETFARAVASHVCAVDNATGAIVSRSGWRRWL